MQIRRWGTQIDDEKVDQWLLGGEKPEIKRRMRGGRRGGTVAEKRA